jgi:hypothetical protein
MRHHQQYQRKQHPVKGNSNDYETYSTGGDDDQVVLFTLKIMTEISIAGMKIPLNCSLSVTSER